MTESGKAKSEGNAASGPRSAASPGAASGGEHQQQRPPPRACGVLVFRDDPEPSFLLMQHHNRWDLPKGHCEPGEDDLTCALRELEEETGIRAGEIEIDPRFRFTTQYPVRYKRKYGGRQVIKTLVIFLGRLKNHVEILTTEHPGFQWFRWSPPHTIQVNTIDPLLKKAAEYWRANGGPW